MRLRKILSCGFVKMSYQIIQDIETVIELRNFSVDGFSKELGVSRVTVNNWLSGKKEINEKNIAAFYEYAFQKGVRLNKIKEQLYREELGDEEDTLLFHGAKTKIERKLGLEYSKKRNDFGNGFYSGESLEQSAMFVATYPQ